MKKMTLEMLVLFGFTVFQIRFNFVTNMTLSFWSKDAVAKRPSLSGLQSTQFTGWSDIWGQGKREVRKIVI